MRASSGVALLRGINVGRAKRIAMADLRALCEQLGFTGVRSLLNSGNLVFASAPHAPREAAAAIEQALLERLGLVSRVTVLSAQELAGVMAANPLLVIATDHARLLVFMLAGAAQRDALAALAARDWAPGALAIGERAAYVWCPEGVLDSAVASAVGKLLGDATTARNWNTLGKLHALCAPRA